MLPFQLARRRGTLAPSEIAGWLVEHGFATMAGGRLQATALGHAAGSGLG